LSELNVTAALFIGMPRVPAFVMMRHIESGARHPPAAKSGIPSDCVGRVLQDPISACEADAVRLHVVLTTTSGSVEARALNVPVAGELALSS
jgi:hypothetical protein